MTTVENVLIYEALERNRIYKENRKKELEIIELACQRLAFLQNKINSKGS